MLFATATENTVSSLLDSVMIQGFALPETPDTNPGTGPGTEPGQTVGGSFFNGVFPSVSPGSSAGDGDFVLEQSFPAFTFTHPVRIVEHPREDQIAIVGKNGQFWQMSSDPSTTTRTLILDITDRTIFRNIGEVGATGFAYHPEFGDPSSPNRGYIYVAYRHHPNQNGNVQNSQNLDAYNRISRFTIADGETQANPNSELILINQYDRQSWHIGGHLIFGQDGFLYIGVGDEGNSEDRLTSTQRIDGGLWSGILRIDVDNDPTRSSPISRQPREPVDLGDTTDQRPANWEDSFSQGYSIPFDNPFFDQDLDPSSGAEAGNLEEFYAIGLRHPWTFSEDPATGSIYYADVGETGFEEVGVIAAGDNHQWGYREGIDGPGPISEPANIIGTPRSPLLDYVHRTGNGCVIGAGVYRGSLYPRLFGKYLFSDFLTGELWCIDADESGPLRIPANGNLPAGVELIAQIPAGFSNGIGSYLMLRDGRILAAQSTANGSIFELTIEGGTTIQPPSLLSETGAFSDLQNLTVAEDFLPFTPNVPFWSDNAIKSRWVAIPNDGIHDSPSEQVFIDETGNFDFPVGTVSMKHFQLALDEDNPNSAINIETRFFVRTELGYYGVSYRWNDAGTDAILLPGGDERPLQITDPSGIVRNQIWEFPSRTDCLTCHTEQSRGFLGTNSHQLNGEQFYPLTGETTNQLAFWNRLGIFTEPLVEENIPNLLAATPTNDTSASLQDRALSYLDSNCAYCHNPEGVRANFDARLTTSLQDSGLINGEIEESLGIVGEAVIVPGSLEQSIAFVRAHSVGTANTMPPLAKNLIDTEGLAVVADWILSLSDSLGNQTEVAGNFRDNHHPSLYINTSDSFTNTENEPQELSMNFFQFYAGNVGNPVTPLIALMNGPEDFTVLAIGETRESDEYTLGSNTFTFNAEGSATVTLQPGETLVTGFMDAFPDGTGWGSGTVITADTTGGQAEDDTFGLLPSPLILQSAGFNPNRDVASIAVGETVAETNAGRNLRVFNLQRSYNYQIPFTIGSAPIPEVDTDGDGVPDNRDAFPNDASETTDTDGDGVGDNSDPAPNNPNIPNNSNNPIEPEPENPDGELIVNGSFEDTPILATTFVTLNPNQVPGWDANGTELEFWADGFLGFNAIDGNQLAELNDLTWEQTVATIPGTTLQWSFYHRGRLTTDTMTLSLGAPGAAPANLFTFTASTPPDAWFLYEGEYTVPAGQVSTTLTLTPAADGGNASNLVDLVSLVGTGGEPVDGPTLLNPSFEDGLASWTSEDVSLSANSLDGAQALALENGFIEQTITGLTPGLVHTLFISYRGMNGLNFDGFLADGQVLVDEAVIGTMQTRSTGYVQFNGFEFIPSTTTASLRIESLEPVQGLIIDDLRLQIGTLPDPPRNTSLQNGSFEDVTGLIGANPHISGFDLPGWLVTQENVDPISTSSFNGWEAFDGEWVLDLGGHGPGGIAQTVTGLTPGSSHVLSFAYARHRGWNQVENLVAEVYANDVLIDTLVRNQNQAVPNWVTTEFTINADSNGEITIEFISLSDTVGGGIIFDDIELNPAEVAETPIDNGGEETAAFNGQPALIPGLVQAENSVLVDEDGQAPFSGTPSLLPGLIEIENFDLGGPGIAYSDIEEENFGATFTGLNYREGGVDIEPSGDIGGTPSLGWTFDGEWLEYTVDITPGVYQLELRAASAGEVVGDLRVLLDGNVLGTFATESTGGWTTWETFLIPNVTVTTGGQQVLRLEMIGQDVNLNWIRFVEANSLAIESFSSAPTSAALLSFDNSTETTQDSGVNSAEEPNRIQSQIDALPQDQPLLAVGLLPLEEGLVPGTTILYGPVIQGLTYELQYRRNLEEEWLPLNRFSPLPEDNGTYMEFEHRLDLVENNQVLYYQVLEEAVDGASTSDLVVGLLAREENLFPGTIIEYGPVEEGLTYNLEFFSVDQTEWSILDSFTPEAEELGRTIELENRQPLEAGGNLHFYHLNNNEPATADQ